MRQFIASSDKVQVNGETVFAVVDGVGAFKSTAIKILENQGITDLHPGEWYSQQAWLNAFKEIAQSIGETTLFMIGQKIPENAKFPPGINDVHQALNIIDVAYQMNHRNGSIGNYLYEKTSDYTGKMLCTNPYPDNFDKGIITSMVKKFNPNSSVVTVKIDESKEIRKNGGNSTTFLISW